eukprot:6085648-Amphidinium_carterae.1
MSTCSWLPTALHQESLPSRLGVLASDTELAERPSSPTSPDEEFWGAGVERKMWKDLPGSRVNDKRFTVNSTH